MRLLQDLWRYLRVRRKYVLLPLLLFLLILGLLVVVTEGSVVAPFIYPLF
jgi:hypothetical protein